MPWPRTQGPRNPEKQTSGHVIVEFFIIARRPEIASHVDSNSILGLDCKRLLLSQQLQIFPSQGKLPFPFNLGPANLKEW